jgi:hypothetical protein
MGDIPCEIIIRCAMLHAISEKLSTWEQTKCEYSETLAEYLTPDEREIVIKRAEAASKMGEQIEVYLSADRKAWEGIADAHKNDSV